MSTEGEPQMQKLAGFDFWRTTLRGARLIVAPMVDQSELAWRLLCQKYGSQLAFSPMYNAGQFIKSDKYRDVAFTTLPEDRPLIVQFAANDPEKLLTAAKYVEDRCDGVDLNLGCPQGIARKGHYGSFLQDEWELIASLVSTLHTQLKVPVTCKIRIHNTVERTIAYAKMLESSGCQLLTVHGRTREQKGPNTGLADWDAIRAVREAVNIPVFANGNIRYASDVDDCIRATGVHGVMAAEGNLADPALFTGMRVPVYRIVDEYLALVQRHPVFQGGCVKAHFFKLYALTLPLFPDLREQLRRAHRLEDYIEVARELNAGLRQLESDYNNNCNKSSDHDNSSATDEPPSIAPSLSTLDGPVPDPALTLSAIEHRQKLDSVQPWMCQPHRRPQKPQTGSANSADTTTDATTTTDLTTTTTSGGDTGEGSGSSGGLKRRRSHESFDSIVRARLIEEGAAPVSKTQMKKLVKREFKLEMKRLRLSRLAKEREEDEQRRLNEEAQLNAQLEAKANKIQATDTNKI